jgi:hypothetical protein
MSMRLAGQVLGVMLATVTLPAVASEEWVGTWSVLDTKGVPFEIIVNADGTAKGTREEGMTGKWTAIEDGIEIKWNTDWRTVIRELNEHYRKTAYAPNSDKPASESDAKKVK